MELFPGKSTNSVCSIKFHLDYDKHGIPSAERIDYHEKERMLKELKDAQERVDLAQEEHDVAKSEAANHRQELPDTEERDKKEQERDEVKWQTRENKLAVERP